MKSNGILQIFCKKFQKGLKRPQEKFVHQMVYGILAGNKLNLSEIARSLKENITLKKTIDRLSKNLNAFDDKDFLMQGYPQWTRTHTPQPPSFNAASRQNSAVEV